VVPVLLVAGWWYARNIQLYGDWSGWNAFIAVLGQRAHPASLAQLWDERWGFMISYWGLFGGLNVPMPEWVYRVLNGVALLAVAGFVIYSIQLVRSWIDESERKMRELAGLVYNLLAFGERHIGLILCFLWAAAVVVGLVQWATVTWSSQGRLVFSSISALSTLLVTGLIAWLPGKPARAVISVLGLFMFTISALAPFLWIGPAYEPAQAQVGSNSRQMNLDFGDAMRLVSFGVEPDEMTPGETAVVVLEWQVLSEMNRDWSVFVHLNDPAVGAPVAQRDMFPGQGLVATRLMSEGDKLVDRYVLRVPETALAPADLTLAVGLYDYQTGERLPAIGGLEAAELAQVSLSPRTGATPNPISVNYENKLELAGFEMPKRRLAGGEDVELSLYLNLLEELGTDYTLFAQIVGEDTTRWASTDLPLPTSDWPAGDVQEVRLQMTLSDDAPAGVYPLIVGFYTRGEDGEFVRLQTVMDEGRLTDDFFALTQVRID
jgi:hypothetical protein